LDLEVAIDSMWKSINSESSKLAGEFIAKDPEKK
jgi:hypothetical protein